MPAASLVAIGRVARPWGRTGAFLVEPLTHDAARFHGLTEVQVVRGGAAETRRVERVELHRDGRPLVWLAGVDSIDAAERLRDARLAVPEEQVVRPAGDAYFNHELVGCAVIAAADGSAVGTVTDILETGGTSLLVVADGRREVLVPATRAILLDVDTAARRIRVALPDGLLDLNGNA